MVQLLKLTNVYYLQRSTNSLLTQQFAEVGYAVVMIDFEGHGRSDGLHAYVETLDHFEEDLNDYLTNHVMALEDFRSKKLFLYGESMGGAISFKLCISQKGICSKISGVCLMAPMLKVADKMKPLDIVINIFKLIEKIIPRAAIAPVPDILNKCFKNKRVLEMARNDTLAYKKQPVGFSCIA